MLTANDGLEALAAINAEQVDAVVTDLAMAKISGLELIQAIRADEQSSRLAVIAMSSFGKNYLQIAKNAGADETIEKSYLLTSCKRLSTVFEIIFVRFSRIQHCLQKALSSASR